MTESREAVTSRQTNPKLRGVFRLANALAAMVGDENGECVACGGSAVGDPLEHHDGCWVRSEIVLALQNG